MRLTERRRSIGDYVLVKAWLFSTSRLAVRPKQLGDVDALHGVYADEEVMRHLGGPFATKQRTHEFVEAHIRHQELHGFSMWTVLEQDSGAVVGDAGFLAYDGGVEIGWRLRRSCWGHGYATEAARGCLVYGFRELHFEAVSAFVETANSASLHVIEKLGMSFVRGGARDAPAWAEYTLAREAPRKRK